MVVAGYKVGLWYVAESSEGSTPNDAAYLHLAHKSEARLTDSPGPNAVHLSGSVDKTAFGKGVENPVITVEFNPSDANGKAFIKNYASSDTPFTLLMMHDAASDVIFARVVGCKVKRISGNVSIYPSHSLLSCTAEIWGGSILYTQSSGTPTFEAAPNSIVNWSNITIKRNTTTLTDWWNFEFEIDNELFRQPTNTGVTSTIERGVRNVSGSLGRPVTDSSQTELDEAKNATEVDLQMLLNSDTYSFNDCAYTEVDIRHPTTDLSGKKMNWSASNLVIT